MRRDVFLKTSQPVSVGQQFDSDDVVIEDTDGNNPMVVAYNQGGFDATCVSLVELLAWVKTNRPDLLT